MNNLVARKEPTEPFIFLPRRDNDRLTMDMRYDDLAPRIIPLLAGRYGDLLAKSPSFEIPQGQGRNPDYSIYNDPRMPGARNLRRKLEGILGLPRIEFPKV